MRHEQLMDLADCTEFRQTLLARPPHIVHGAAILLGLLLSVVIAWSWMTSANLVVRATGRVRPVSTPTGVYAAFGSKIDGRVIEVNYSEGEAVRAGQPLIRFDTQQLDNDISRQTRAVASIEQELAKLTDLCEFRQQQFDAARAKAQAELDLAVAGVERARALREAALRRARIDLEDAQQRLSRKRDLFARKALSRVDLMDAETAFQQTSESLAEAELPVDDTSVSVAERGSELIEQDYAAEQAELEINRVAKEGELASAQRDLAGLELERGLAVLTAPADGVVITPAVKVGDVLERGVPVLEIAARTGFHFEAAVPSGDVGELQPGMPVQIKLDAYDYQEYGTLSGTVCFISPDSRLAESGDRGQPVYVVEVELVGDTLGRGQLSGEIKLGMLGLAEFRTGQDRLLVLLFQKLRQTISLG